METAVLEQDLQNGTTVLDLHMMAHRNEKVVIASPGFQADMKALHRQLQARSVMYQHDHNR
jgi:20S proteasome subunit beta 6